MARVIVGGPNGKRWYSASANDGFADEKPIREIWLNDK
jgi:hypothetical protein